LPLFFRISATDWAPGGWTVEDSVELVRLLAPLGIDLVDCSSGGLVPRAKIEVRPGYQVPFAREIRAATGVMTGAVGMITDPKQAEEILEEKSADVIVMAREFLREPYWPIKAASALGGEVTVPNQYARAFVSAR
jgi:2,4-dienoyl-CoA reductase-like NADH-dependent reductase (Old Yellow Enzyme family)